jgi:hypothetical protein
MCYYSREINRDWSRSRNGRIEIEKTILVENRKGVYHVDDLDVSGE